MTKSIVNIIAIAYWPLLVATSLLLWKYWRRLDNTKAGIIVIIAVIAFCTTMSVIAHENAIAMFDLYLLFVVFGFALLALAVIGVRSPTKAKGIMKAVIFVFIVCLGLASASYYSWLLIGDFFLPRSKIEGIIDRLDEEQGRRLRFYHVYIDGKRYLTTADIYDAIRPNTRVRAELGVGSRTIFHIQPVLVAD